MSQTSKTKRSKRAALTTAALSASLLSTAALGTGCEMLGLGGEETVTPPAQQAQAPPATPPAATPTPTPTPAAEPEEYQRPEYENMARRNPFQPDLEVVQPANLPAAGDERTLEPLERFSIGELELVAIISEVAVPKAMFIDPEGFGHVLKEGDRIGRNSGTISDIRDNEVEVTETAGEDGGQTRLRTVKLRDAELAVGDDSGLSDEERAALEKLLQTEEGRKAVEQRYRDMALGASAVEQPGGTPQGQAPPARFPGVRPPSQQDN